MEEKDTRQSRYGRRRKRGFSFGRAKDARETKALEETLEQKDVKAMEEAVLDKEKTQKIDLSRELEFLGEEMAPIAPVEETESEEIDRTLDDPEAVEAVNLEVPQQEDLEETVILSKEEGDTPSEEVPVHDAFYQLDEDEFFVDRTGETSEFSLDVTDEKKSRKKSGSLGKWLIALASLLVVVSACVVVFLLWQQRQSASPAKPSSAVETTASSSSNSSASKEVFSMSGDWKSQEFDEFFLNRLINTGSDRLSDLKELEVDLHVDKKTATLSMNYALDLDKAVEDVQEGLAANGNEGAQTEEEIRANIVANWKATAEENGMTFDEATNRYQEELFQGTVDEEAQTITIDGAEGENAVFPAGTVLSYQLDGKGGFAIQLDDTSFTFTKENK